MRISNKSVKNVQIGKKLSAKSSISAIFANMKPMFLFLFIALSSLEASAAVNCQEKIAKLLGLPKMASVSINPMPATEEYQDYFVSYMTEEKMGTLIARCFNDETKDAFAVPETNPGANPATENPYGTPAAAPAVEAELYGPPIPKASQIQWRIKN